MQTKGAAETALQHDSLLRFELTAQFLDSEAQALADLIPHLTRDQVRQLLGGEAGFIRMGRLIDALRSLRVALFEAGFTSRSA